MTSKRFAEHRFDDGSRITVGRLHSESEGRHVYGWTVEDASGQHIGEGAGLRSGACGVGGTPQQMLGSLATFLSACAESREYRTRTGKAGENADLFTDAVGQWAEEHADELSLFAYDLDDES